MDEHFGDLRSTLHDTPSAAAWARLCEVIDAWERERFEDEAYAYVSQELEDWPDELRVAPEGWVELIESRDPPRKLALARRYGQVKPSAETLGRWIDSGILVHLDDFDLTDIEDESVLERFAEAGAFARVRRLNLENNSVGLDVFRKLVESPNLTHIEWLNVGWTGLSSDEAGELVGAAPWRDLEYLHIEGNGIQEEGGVALVSSPHLVSLTGLRLGWNDVGGATCEALANTAVFTHQLTELGLENNSIEDRGAVTLCASSRLSNLTEFDLYNNSLTRATARAIADNPALANVVTMDLNANAIGDEGRAALSASIHLSDNVLERVARFEDVDS